MRDSRSLAGAFHSGSERVRTRMRRHGTVVPKRLLTNNFSRNGAAQESNLPSVGLRRRTGFEDKLHLAVDSPVRGLFPAMLGLRAIVCATGGAASQREQKRGRRGVVFEGAGDCAPLLPGTSSCR